MVRHRTQGQPQRNLHTFAAPGAASSSNAQATAFVQRLLKEFTIKADQPSPFDSPADAAAKKSRWPASGVDLCSMITGPFVQLELLDPQVAATMVFQAKFHAPGQGNIKRANVANGRDQLFESAKAVGMWRRGVPSGSLAEIHPEVKVSVGWTLICESCHLEIAGSLCTLVLYMY